MVFAAKSKCLVRAAEDVPSQASLKSVSGVRMHSARYAPGSRLKSAVTTVRRRVGVVFARWKQYRYMFSGEGVVVVGVSKCSCRLPSRACCAEGPELDLVCRL